MSVWVSAGFEVLLDVGFEVPLVGAPNIDASVLAALVGTDGVVVAGVDPKEEDEKRELELPGAAVVAEELNVKEDEDVVVPKPANPANFGGGSYGFYVEIMVLYSSSKAHRSNRAA